MDADSEESIRGRNLSSNRSERYSMDAQRFDEILAEIKTGYSNISNNFENVKIAEILEEMLTEYVREALASESAGGAGGAEGGAPNFAEVAVLLQHCAALYGRKVDYLYQHVVDVSESLAHAAPEESAAESGGAGAEADAEEEAEEAEAGAGAKRGKKRGAAEGVPSFTHIKLTEWPGATRRAEPPRPPPTLPRAYLELEPRVVQPHDLQLTDYDGEPIGLPSDFHVLWRLQDGFLVDSLQTGGGDTSDSLRPLSLVELQAAIEAAAPPSPPSPPPCASPPLCSSTPLPPARAATPPPSPALPTDLTVALNKRKRKNSAKLEELMEGSFKLLITKDVVLALGQRAEFCVAAAWRRRELAARAQRILAARLRLTNVRAWAGFEYTFERGGGFPGWTDAEGAAARGAAGAAAAALWLRAADLDSDDDGFYEWSSLLSGSSYSRTDCSAQSTTTNTSEESRRQAVAAGEALAARAAAGEAALAAAAAWGAAVAARAAAAEARGALDVRALGARVLRALPPPPPPPPRAPPLPFRELLLGAAREPQDVSRLLLASLFLTNSGNLEITPGPPLSVGEFALSVVSTDEGLYSAASAEYFT